MRRSVLIAFLTLSLLPVASTAWAKSDKNRTDSLSGKFAKISQAELALTEVPHAPGAPAVVLFEGQQYYFDRPATSAPVTRSVYQRRIKILTEGGVERYGDFVRTFKRNIENLKVRARTILPDGTVIDATEEADPKRGAADQRFVTGGRARRRVEPQINATSNVYQDRGETGERVVSIAFPRVQVGAILEVIIQHNIEAIYETSWPVQDRIPVLESLFVYSPPREMQFQQAAALMSEEEAEPKVRRSPRGLTFSWRFTDQPPIPVEPNQPPFIELTKTLYVIPTAWRGPGYHLEFASDWATWNRQEAESWETWIRTRREECRRLARSVTEGIESDVDRVEALRQELNTRIRPLTHSSLPMRRSPDEALAKGSGSSADVAAAMVAMLRDLEIKADLVAIRHREDGLMPEDFPMPILFNDMLVRVKTEMGTLHFSPVAAFPAWELPGFARGVVAMPIDRKSTSPVRLPEMTGGMNVVVRDATVEIGAGGEITVSSTHTFTGVWAETWRGRLRDREEDERAALLQEDLRRWAPGARVDSVEIENLGDPIRDLTVRCRFSAENYASSVGKRLLVNLHLFERVAAEDWPAGSRISTIDLGVPFESRETVRLSLPPDLEQIDLPPPAEIEAGQVGFYTTDYSKEDDSLVARRHVRVNVHRFPAKAYPDLRDWFLDMAEQDDQPVVLRTR